MLLPKILKSIFKNNNNIPKYFIQNIDELFKIWKNRWDLFDDKYFQGLFMYTYNLNCNSYISIENYYDNYIQDEIDKFLENIHDYQKIKVLGVENGLDTDCDFLEMIDDLKKIKKMELIISLSKDLDGNECNGINQISEKETSKLQRILKNMNENLNSNNDKNINTINTINLNDKNNSNSNSKKDKNANFDGKKERVNTEQINEKKEQIYDDLDGEPL